MHLGFHYPRRSHVAPGVRAVYTSCVWWGMWDLRSRCSRLAHLQEPLLLPLPVAVLLRRALVVALFAACLPHFELCSPARPMQLQRHRGIPPAFHCASELVELATVQEQFSRAHWIRGDVRGGTGQGGDMCAGQPSFAVAKLHVAFLQLDPALAQALDLPAFERQTGFDMVLDEVVVPRLFIECDNARRVLLVFLLTHR